MNAALHRPAVARDSIRLIVRIVAVLAAGLLTGAILGFGAVATYDMLRVNQPLLYSAD
ncbi:hypothetical protein GCM10007036_01290 [Alsobacter metallidurans]|uniref:Uncharacterized protein n=1 Tax=Alsobacter metallidurans TaxID=340221 RepID=A0A917I2V5_9HYPH|nr:hypothetical protein [Alsobacter metallidurans]GGH06805.1 hypothetical protein GCM10007036_01290 [Alsobacter metallidurans]